MSRSSFIIKTSSTPNQELTRSVPKTVHIYTEDVDLEPAIPIAHEVYFITIVVVSDHSYKKMKITSALPCQSRPTVVLRENDCPLSS